VKRKSLENVGIFGGRAEALVEKVSGKGGKRLEKRGI
jgi:hypothetical protein